MKLKTAASYSTQEGRFALLNRRIMFSELESDFLADALEPPKEDRPVVIDFRSSYSGSTSLSVSGA